MHVTQSQKIRFFDDCADTWDQNPEFSRNQQRLATLIPALDISEGDRVLDVGSGTGIAISPLKETVRENGIVIGLDMSHDMIRNARRRHEQLVRADCHALPFPKYSFDWVFAFAVLPHLKDIPRFFQEAAAVLSPNGRMVILHFMSRAVINDFHRNAGTAVAMDTLPTFDELRAYGTRAGLRQRRCQENENLFLWMGAMAGGL